MNFDTQVDSTTEEYRQIRNSLCMIHLREFERDLNGYLSYGDEQNMAFFMEDEEASLVDPYEKYRNNDDDNESTESDATLNEYSDGNRNAHYYTPEKNIIYILRTWNNIVKLLEQEIVIKQQGIEQIKDKIRHAFNSIRPPGTNRWDIYRAMDNIPEEKRWRWVKKMADADLEAMEGKLQRELFKRDLWLTRTYFFTDEVRREVFHIKYDPTVKFTFHQIDSFRDGIARLRMYQKMSISVNRKEQEGQLFRYVSPMQVQFIEDLIQGTRMYQHHFNVPLQQNDFDSDDTDHQKVEQLRYILIARMLLEQFALRKLAAGETVGNITPQSIEYKDFMAALYYRDEAFNNYVTAVQYLRRGEPVYTRRHRLCRSHTKQMKVFCELLFEQLLNYKPQLDMEIPDFLPDFEPGMERLGPKIYSVFLEHRDLLVLDATAPPVTPESTRRLLLQLGLNPISRAPRPSSSTTHTEQSESNSGVVENADTASDEDAQVNSTLPLENESTNSPVAVEPCTQVEQQVASSSSSASISLDVDCAASNLESPTTTDSPMEDAPAVGPSNASRGKAQRQDSSDYNSSSSNSLFSVKSSSASLSADSEMESLSPEQAVKEGAPLDTDMADVPPANPTAEPHAYLLAENDGEEHEYMTDSDTSYESDELDLDELWDEEYDGYGVEDDDSDGDGYAGMDEDDYDDDDDY